MSNRIHTYPKRYSGVKVASGSDYVMFGFPLPAGAMVHQSWMEISTVIPAVDVDIATVHNVMGYILPVLDLDAGLSQNQMWDNQIPKDSPDDTEGGVDIDYGAADLAPIIELGDVHNESIINLGVQPRKIFKREVMGTFAKTPVAFEVDGISAGNDSFSSTDHFSVHMTRKLRVSVPSWMLIGIGVADGADVGTTNFIVDTAAEWAQLQYMRIALEDAFKAMISVSQVAGDDPYNQALILIHNYLEEAFNSNAGMFDSTGYTLQAWGKMTAHISMDGDFDAQAMSAQA